MSKIKEIAEKSEGRVIIATLPKNEAEKPNTEAQTQERKTQDEKAQELPKKTLEQTRAEFDRLNRLFYRQRCFEGAIKRINEYRESLTAESPTELESKNYKLILGSGYNKEDVTITNREVIADTITYLRARMENTINGIMDEILKG